MAYNNKFRGEALPSYEFESSGILICFSYIYLTMNGKISFIN